MDSPTHGQSDGGGKRYATWEEALDATYAQARAIMVERHKKYGAGNFNRHGGYGVLVRMNDKLSRLEGIYESGRTAAQDFGDEPELDTWIDIANYGVIGLMLKAGTWALPAAALGEVPDGRERPENPIDAEYARDRANYVIQADAPPPPMLSIAELEAQGDAARGPGEPDPTPVQSEIEKQLDGLTSYGGVRYAASTLAPLVEAIERERAAWRELKTATISNAPSPARAAVIRKAGDALQMVENVRSHIASTDTGAITALDDLREELTEIQGIAELRIEAPRDEEPGGYRIGG